MRRVALVLVLAGLVWGCGGGDNGSAPSASTNPTPPAREFFVAPEGDDSGPGTREAPFRTPERARQAVRFSNDGSADLVVTFRGGVHRLEHPLVLEAADSGRHGHQVIYRAQPGEHPVLRGSVRVTNFQLWDATHNIYRASVGHRSSRQLYVNGQRAIRARTEAYPVGFRPQYIVFNGVPEPLGIEYVPPPSPPPGWVDPARWTNLTGVEAVIKTQWKMMRVPLAGRVLYPDLTPDPILAPQQRTGLLTVQEPAWTNANTFLLQGILQPGPWSFWQVTWFENALELLDSPGEWYLDSQEGYLYYMPRPGEDLRTATVELPVLETLVEALGTASQPVTDVRFEGLVFSQATWLGPSGNNGYVADQSGFCLVGQGHAFNVYGHAPDVVRTPGGLSFRFVRNITFKGNIVEHMGGVGLDFDTGSQGNTIQDNLFEDTSSAALQLGGVGPDDHHPSQPEQVTRDNIIRNNLIRQTGREYVDSAGIMVGFTENTLIQSNSIVDTPWSGIAMGWGWGLLDPGMFPGLPGANRGEWGVYTSPTPSRRCRILQNRIHSFLNEVWDGGAVYTTGAQGTSMEDALLIEGNVADGKRPRAGGNTFYTDGGSRYIVVRGNASFNNPQGVTDFGPAPQPGDPLPYPPYYLANDQPYGSDAGGCLTYGDIAFTGNYLLYGNFDAICPYPPGLALTNLSQTGDTLIQGEADVPPQILRDAGVRQRPPSIPPERWVLP